MGTCATKPTAKAEILEPEIGLDKYLLSISKYEWDMIHKYKSIDPLKIATIDDFDKAMRCAITMGDIDWILTLLRHWKCSPRLYGKNSRTDYMYHSTRKGSSKYISVLKALFKYGYHHDRSITKHLVHDTKMILKQGYQGGYQYKFLEADHNMNRNIWIESFKFFLFSSMLNIALDYYTTLCSFGLDINAVYVKNASKRKYMTRAYTFLDLLNFEKERSKRNPKLYEQLVKIIDWAKSVGAVSIYEIVRKREH